MFEFLQPLDYARQAAWNIPASLAKGDFLGALPGLLGGAAGLGLAATGVGAPLALLGGSLAGALGQGVGKATGSESFDAPEASELVKALGMDPESGAGMALGFGAHILGDPLTYAGGAFGHGLARKAGQEAALARFGALHESPVNSVLQEALASPAGKDTNFMATLRGTGQDAQAARTQDLGQLVGGMAKSPEPMAPLAEPGAGLEQTLGDIAGRRPSPVLSGDAFPVHGMKGRLSPVDTHATEAMLYDLLKEDPGRVGWHQDVAGLVNELQTKGLVSDRPWNLENASWWPVAEADKTQGPTFRSMLQGLHGNMLRQADQQTMQQILGGRVMPNLDIPVHQAMSHPAEAELLRLLNQGTPGMEPGYTLREMLDHGLRMQTRDESGLPELLAAVSRDPNAPGLNLHTQTMGEQLDKLQPLQQLGMGRLAGPGTAPLTLQDFAQLPPLNQLSPDLVELFHRLRGAR